MLHLFLSHLFRHDPHGCLGSGGPCLQDLHDLPAAVIPDIQRRCAHLFILAKKHTIAFLHVKTFCKILAKKPKCGSLSKKESRLCALYP
jgi:hypothetical protein